MQKCPGSENFPRNYSHWCSTGRVENVKISGHMIIGQGKDVDLSCRPEHLGDVHLFYSYWGFQCSIGYFQSTYITILFGNHIE